MKLKHAVLLQTEITSKVLKCCNEEFHSSTDNLAVELKLYTCRNLSAHVCVYAN